MTENADSRALLMLLMRTQQRLRRDELPDGRPPRMPTSMQVRVLPPGRPRRLR